jgi:hypothetical protein
VFDPMHVGKKGLLPNLFSQIESSGCSIQRESKAQDAELLEFVRTFLTSKPKQKWHGVAKATCADLRKAIDGRRLVCLYDTALSHNPSHAEMLRTRYAVPEADVLEMRKHVWTSFGSGAYTSRNDYRAGAIWNTLPVACQR